MIQMMLSYLRDKVNFCLNLCLIKDEGELENLGEKGKKKSRVFYTKRNLMYEDC